MADDEKKQPFLRKWCGYNLRERMNVYAGLTLGVVLPTALMRYTAIKPANDDLKTQLACGALAIGLAIPYMLVTIPAGFFTGMISASRLRNRDIRESELVSLSRGDN